MSASFLIPIALVFFLATAKPAISAPKDSVSKGGDVMLAAKVAAKGDPVLDALLVEMERSPILSPLRLRIAMGIVAADRSPYVYAPSHKPISDRTWIIVMAWGFGIAMLLHLVLIVMLAIVSGH